MKIFLLILSFLQLFTFRSFQLYVEFQKNPMCRFEEKVFAYWNIDILTHWQRWFHRIPFRQKVEVQKSTLELQQFLRYIGFKNFFGHAWAYLTIPT